MNSGFGSKQHGTLRQKNPYHTAWRMKLSVNRRLTLLASYRPPQGAYDTALEICGDKVQLALQAYDAVCKTCI
jgi:hypothetical protein